MANGKWQMANVMLGMCHLPSAICHLPFSSFPVLAQIQPSLLWSFLIRGYLFSIAVETPILLIGLSPAHSMKRRLVAGIWLTACTYPVVVLVLPLLLKDYWQYLMAAETFAPVAECALFSAAFHRFHTRQVCWEDRIDDWLTITTANVASFLLGELFTVLGWL